MLDGMARVWLPVPSINSDCLQSLDSSFSSNGAGKLIQDGQNGAKMLYVEFAAGKAKPFVELTSRVRTQSRMIDGSQKTAALEDVDTLLYFTRPTALIPTDGIVRKTALAATRGATSDVEKTQKIYDWVVANTYRESKVRLPYSKGDAAGFFMNPMAENAAGRFDSYAPDDFKYQITAREINA